MNGKLPTPHEIAEIRLNYPPGCRIELNHIEDPYAVPGGTRGTVEYVDDGGNIHTSWDNGRTLSVISGVDSFRKLTWQEVQEEQTSNAKDHPTLYGYGATREQELHSVKEVAQFIYEEGLKGDVQIKTQDGGLFISTFGIFIDRIVDMEYRAKLLEELVPLQMGEQPHFDSMKME